MKNKADTGVEIVKDFEDLKFRLNIFYIMMWS